MLRRALETARFPMALIICSDSSTGGVARTLDTLLGATASQPHFVCHVSCNAIADTLLSKALRSIAAAEQLPVSPETVAQIVRASNGDLRHALNKLQFLATGAARAKPSSAKGSSKAKAPKGAKGVAKGAPGAASLVGGSSDLQERDRFRDVFHTIGKLLHAPAKRAKLIAERGGAPAGIGGAAGGAGAGGGTKEPAAAGDRWWEHAQRPGADSGRSALPSGAAAATSGAQGDGGGAPEADGRRHSARAASSPGWTTQAEGWPVGCLSSFSADACSSSDPAYPPFASLAALFDSQEPEQMLDSSALDDAAVLAFLQQNYLPHFGSADDVADAAAALSDAATLAAEARVRPWHAMTLLPLAGSLSSRAIVTCNRHPEPSRFTSCTKPAMFGAERTAKERSDRLALAFAPTDTSDSTTIEASHNPHRGVAPTDNRSSSGLLAPAGMLGGAQLACELVPYLPRLLPKGAGGPYGVGGCGGGGSSGGSSGGGGSNIAGGAAGAQPRGVGLTPSQRDCVVELTSLGGRDTGAAMAPAVLPPPTRSGGGGAGSLGRAQVLEDDIEE